MEKELIFSDIVQRAEALIKAEAGDYEQDGLLYCGKCHTPKQTVIGINGVIYKPKCLCRCQADKLKADEQAFSDRLYRERILRLRHAAFSERMMESWTFANDDLGCERITNAMRRYTDRFSEMKSRGKGLLLYGPVGTGKTYAACEAANALIDKGIPCLVTNFLRLSNNIMGRLDSKQEFIDSLNDYELLVIDDLGAERKSEYMQETVFSIIDSRYRSGLPMIITTNLPIEAIKKPENVNYARIYDRIIERCFPIEVSGKSRRRAAVRADYQDMKSVLGL